MTKTFLRIPRIPVDERRRAHLRRRLYNFWQEYNGSIGLFFWSAAFLLMGAGLWWIYGTWPR